MSTNIVNNIQNATHKNAPVSYKGLERVESQAKVAKGATLMKVVDGDLASKELGSKVSTGQYALVESDKVTAFGADQLAKLTEEGALKAELSSKSIMESAGQTQTKP